MDINSVGIRNFLIISEVDAILSGRGLTRIAGENLDDTTSSSNGSGKSCILEAVYWCLFGDTLRSIKSADGVVNNNVKKDCSVIVQMSEGDTKYRVERYRKHSKKKNNLYLYINGIDSRGKDNKETQEFIESVIGMDKVSFANSIVFGQGHSKNLKRFSEMGDAEKKATMERVLDIEAFARAHDHSKKILSDLSSDIEMLRRERKHYLARQEDLTKSIVECKRRIAEGERELLQKKKTVDEELEYCIEKLSSEKKALSGMPETKDVSDIEDRISQCEELEKSEKMKRDSLIKRYRERRDEIVSRKGRISGVIGSFKARIAALSDGSDAGEHCNHCGSVVTVDSIESHKDYLEFEIADNLRSVKALAEKLESLSKSYESRKEKIETSIRAARGLSKQFTAELIQQSKIESEKQSLKSRIETYTQEIEFLKNRIKELEEETEEVPWKGVLASEERELSGCKEKIKSFDSELEQKSEKMAYVNFWANGFSRKGIRSFMLDKVVPYINDRLNHYLNILTDGGITARFSTVKQLASGEYREDFNLKIKNKKASETYEGNSGGERRRVDLAVALAFNDFIASRSGKRFNILLLDEVFEGVDAEGLYYVIKVLEDLARRKSSVFVITHRDELKSYFSDEIILQRKDGMSISI
tara:strand:- start:10584 stop:12518 length:1935 start_codon:yes stop_codon:yes gene_type:complete